MSYELLNVDESKICAAYPVSSLAGKFLVCGKLSDAQIHELLSQDMNLSTSKAECIQKCAERILRAAADREKVFIGGDYDCDGITATAILKDTLEHLKIETGYYIPDRFKEGYGLRPETVEKAYAKGYSLIITVDNGVKAHAAIAKAKELGMDIIVTDHHQIDEEINADLVVHPNYMEDAFQYLSGAGVALEISRFLLGEVPLHTSLAAIASIGDAMPLWKETRKIVKAGFRAIETGNCPSVSAMLRKGSSIDPVTCSFQIVPKINSVGRLNERANVNTLVPFLLSRNPSVIANYVEQLNKVNDLRKSLSTEMTGKAQEYVTEDSILVIYDESFHEGICGLTAGKIANTYHKPTLVFAKGDGVVKGSGRSISGFNMFEFFSSDFEMLTAFGGHEMAVGLSMNEEDFERFTAKVHEKAKEQSISYAEEKDYAVSVTDKDISLDAIMELESLKPYPKELVTSKVALSYVDFEKEFESPKVVKYRIPGGTSGLEIVGFGSQKDIALEFGDTVIGELSINRFRSRVTPQLTIDEVIKRN